MAGEWEEVSGEDVVNFEHDKLRADMAFSLIQSNVHSRSHDIMRERVVGHGKEHRSQPSRFRRDCTELHYYIPPSRFTNLLSHFHRFGRDVLYSGAKCLAIMLYRALVPLSCPLFFVYI